MKVRKTLLMAGNLPIVATWMALLITWPQANAADAKLTRFWNLTGETIVKLELSPAGKNDFGSDQCANDSDHAVDDDERLPVRGVASGSYDARLTFKSGRMCMAKTIAIQDGKVFSIDGKQLTDCHELK